MAFNGGSGRHARPKPPRAGGKAASSLVIAAGAIASGAFTTVTAQAAMTASSAYTVEPGDSLSGIAVKENVPGGWSALASANHIASPYIIHPGETLVLPVGSTTSPFPVPVTAGTSRQVITVQANGSHATVTVWQKTASTWAKKYTTTSARIGAHGITNGTTRKQGTGTTPTGTYTITQGFGVAANPGTKVPYHHVTSQDWWVEDPDSAYYNQMRQASQGGFPLTESGDHGSEHLINYPTQYHNALVINYNMHPAVKGRGAGIFLHDLGPQAGPTAGCVAVPQTVLTQILRWIDPAQHPVIAIG